MNLFMASGFDGYFGDREIYLLFMEIATVVPLGLPL
jgi:hypothetical protein